jgi:hypothetical protein
VVRSGAPNLFESFKGQSVRKRHKTWTTSGIPKSANMDFYPETLR